MKKITKEEYEKVKRDYLLRKGEIDEKKNKNPLGFFKFAQKGAIRTSARKPGEILVFLLNLKGQIEGPILTQIYGGNFLVIRNRVYRFNPKRVFTFLNKYKAVIAREFDRELVGNDDYEELVAKDFSSNNPGRRVNIDDPVLIKALIQARLGEKTITASKGKIILIGIIVLALVIGFFWLTGR
jgi:hypothetical protein